MIDYHIHPSYSCDARGALKDFCESALNNGISEIAFTTHVDSDRKADDHFVLVEGKKIDIRNNEWLEHYENSILEIADQYKHKGLIVRLGAEVDIYPGVASNLPENFYRADFDLIIGSVHLIDHIALSTEDGAKKIFSRHSLNDLGRKYFNLLLDALDEQLIDIIGHLDIYRRYGVNYFGEKINTIWKPYIESLSNRMKSKNLGFEINTSTWRKGLEQPMPAKNLIEELVNQGVDVVTTGSDAHEPKDVGYGIERAADLIHEMGIENPARFKNRHVI